MDLLNYALRWLHILSAIVMVGGVFYLRFAVLPAATSLPDDQSERLRGALRRSWAKWVMISIALLLATGLANMFLIPMQNEFPEGANYGMLVGIKFMLALPVFFIVSTLNGRSKNAERFRQKTRLWLNVALVLSVIIVCLGGYLRFVPRTPQADSASSEAAASFRPPAKAALSGPTLG